MKDFEISFHTALRVLMRVWFCLLQYPPALQVLTADMTSAHCTDPKYSKKILTSYGFWRIKNKSVNSACGYIPHWRYLVYCISVRYHVTGTAIHRRSQLEIAARGQLEITPFIDGFLPENFADRNVFTYRWSACTWVLLSTWWTPGLRTKPHPSLSTTH